MGKKKHKFGAAYEKKMTQLMDDAVAALKKMDE